MRKLVWLLFVVVFLAAVGCSGSSGVTPDGNRTSMEDFFSKLTWDDSIAGHLSVADGNGAIVFESDLVRDDDGQLQLVDARQGEVMINLVAFNIVDCTVDYLNPAGFTPDGRALYYIGSTMEYNLNVLNRIFTINNASVQAEQRYLGGPLNGQLLPGASTETWLHQTLLGGPNVFFDTYYIPPGTLPGNDVTHAKIWVPINFWWFHFDLILFNNAAGLWDP